MPSILGSANDRIAVMSPALPMASSVLPYLELMDGEGIYSNFGPLVTQLEQRYASLLGVMPQQVVTSANATLALAGAVAAQDKSEWSVPAWTFPATAHAPLLVGRRLAFADVSLDSWLLGEDSRPKRGENRGRIPVIPFGASFQLDDFDLEEESLVIDAAASLGNFPNLESLPQSWAVVFSLHATKILGCGEGALTIFGSSQAADEFRAWSNFGFAGSRVPRFVATNAKMSEIAAAYALAALDQWKTSEVSWRRIHATASAISEKHGLARSPRADSSLSPYWIGVFKDESATKKAELVFAANAIDTRRWWPEPLSHSPAFSNYARGAYPNCDLLSRVALGLPMHLALTPENFNKIDEALAATFLPRTADGHRLKHQA